MHYLQVIYIIAAVCLSNHIEYVVCDTTEEQQASGEVHSKFGSLKSLPALKETAESGEYGVNEAEALAGSELEYNRLITEKIHSLVELLDMMKQSGGAAAAAHEDGSQGTERPSEFKRSQAFLRFGKRAQPSYLRFGRSQAFLRFGRNAKRNPAYLRFGRSSD